MLRTLLELSERGASLANTLMEYDSDTDLSEVLPRTLEGLSAHVESLGTRLLLIHKNTTQWSDRGPPHHLSCHLKLTADEPSQLDLNSDDENVPTCAWLCVNVDLSFVESLITLSTTTLKTHDGSTQLEYLSACHLPPFPIGVGL